MVGKLDDQTLLGFGLMVDENRHCIHLNGNECGIYENRPMICRIDEFRERFMPDMDKTDFYKLQRKTYCDMEE